MRLPQFLAFRSSCLSCDEFDDRIRERRRQVSGARVRALDGVSFTAERGKVTAVAGPKEAASRAREVDA